MSVLLLSVTEEVVAASRYLSARCCYVPLHATSSPGPT